MTVSSRLRCPFGTLIFVSLLGIGVGCGKGSSNLGIGAGNSTDLPSVSPGLELQDEDYAVARSKFHTKLIRVGPAPQSWQPVRAPKGVKEIRYQSSGLQLRAWINLPKDGAKSPAVLYLHGGWAFGQDDWEQAEPLRDAGYIVMTPLLRGENGQPGNFTMFYDEIDDVLAAVDYLAKVPNVDSSRIYLAGHSAGGTHAMLAAMASDRFRALASVSGSPDRISFVNSGYGRVAPFDKANLRELQLRSPVAFAGSFKCPARLYVGSQESYFFNETRRTALLAKSRGLDVESVIVAGDHMSCVPEALRQAIEFFRKQ